MQLQQLQQRQQRASVRSGLVAAAAARRHSRRDGLVGRQTSHARRHARRPQATSGSNNNSSDINSSSGTQPPSAADAVGQDAVSQAREELQAAWQQLKDTAAATFLPGYSSSSASNAAAQGEQQQQQQAYQRVRPGRTYSSVLQQAQQQQRSSSSGREAVTSIPDRLKRLLTLQFLRPGPADAGAKPFNAQLAAVRFELQQALQQEARAAQQQQQQQQGAAGDGPVIEVLPDDPQPSQSAAEAAAAGQAQPAAAAAAGPPASSSSSTGEPAAAAAFGDAADAAAVNSDAAGDFYPATARMLQLATWAVFLLQWWPALPELCKAAMRGAPGQALLALLLAFPDNGATRALCLDLAALQAGASLGGFFTAGLLHSGLLAVTVNTAALFDAGRWLEAGTGPLQLLSTFLLASAAAGLAHVLAGSSMLAVTGSGAVIGVYAAWVVQATLHLGDETTLRELYIAAGVLLVLNLLLGLLQPGVGLASIVGGVAGGLLAVKAAATLAQALYWGLAAPVLGVMLLCRLALDAAKIALLAAALVAGVAVQGVAGLVQAVRKI